MKTKHTLRFFPFGPNGEFICEAKSNARIISSAPELKEALEALLAQVSDKEIAEHDEPGQQGHDPKSCAICMAINALKKANG